MAGKRKLFLTHAGELANILVHAVARDGLVARFVKSYATRHNRPKLASDPDRVRELERTIGREALLVITVELRELFPRVFATGRGGALRPDEAAMSQAFSEEFVTSLRRAFDWQPSEAGAETEAFNRDLEIYEQWSKRSMRSTGGGLTGSGESPFPDRCAILLDPAMMEQARRAASKFADELGLEAAQILDRLGRTGVRVAAPKRKSAKRIGVRKPKAAARRARKPKRSAKKPVSRKQPSRKSASRKQAARRPRR